MLDRFVQQLGKELKMENQIIVKETGHYVLPFADEIDVDAMQSSLGNYLFKSTIGTCPSTNVEPFLVRSLEMNLLGRATRGAAIGLNEEGNLLTLSLEVDYNSTYKEWKEKLEDFVSVLAFWRQEALKHT